MLNEIIDNSELASRVAKDILLTKQLLPVGINSSLKLFINALAPSEQIFSGIHYFSNDTRVLLSCKQASLFLVKYYFFASYPYRVLICDEATV